MNDFARLVIQTVANVICVCSLISCATKTSTVGSRNPSSAAESQINGDEAAFQLMFWTDRTEESLFRKLSQIEEVFYRAQDLTAQFDALLLKSSRKKNQNPDDFLKRATQQGIYPKLQALQQIGEETNTRLLYFAKRLSEIADDAAAQSKTRTKAENALKYLANYLAQSPNSLRLALNAFAQSLHDDQPDVKGFDKAFTRLFVGKFEEQAQFSKEAVVKKHLAYMTKKNSRMPGYLLVRMEELAKTLTPDLLANMDSERSPQAVEGALRTTKHPAGNFALLYEGPAQKSGVESILTTLQSGKAVGSFFTPAKSENESLSKKIVDAGMTLGNGTVNRIELPKTFDAELATEVEGPMHGNSLTTPPTIRVLFLPFGAGMNSKRVQQVVQKNHLRVVSSQIPSLSWADFDADRIVDRLSRQMRMSKSGNVILNTSTISARVSSLMIKTNNPSRHFVDLKAVAGE